MIHTTAFHLCHVKRVPPVVPLPPALWPPKRLELAAQAAPVSSVIGRFAPLWSEEGTAPTRSPLCTSHAPPGRPGRIRRRRPYHVSCRAEDQVRKAYLCAWPAGPGLRRTCMFPAQVAKTCARRGLALPGCRDRHTYWKASTAGCPLFGVLLGPYDDVEVLLI